MIPNPYYREDIGDRWFEEGSDGLHSWGCLRDSSGETPGTTWRPCCVCVTTP
jgi:hypothetical protein